MKSFRFEINIKNKKSLLTFPDEEILIAKRQHWLVLFSSVVTSSIVGTIFLLLAYLFSWIVLKDGLLIFLSITTVLLLSASIIIKNIINWYYHVYIITNHKIIEYDCKPFFSEGVSDILLDLVRCTEIDIHTKGVINQIFDKGDIYITFDRPTHEEGFVIKDIDSPKLTGELLNQVFIADLSNNNSNATWVKNKNGKGKYRYIEEILPQKRKVWS